MVEWLVRRPRRGSLGFKPAGEWCENYRFFAKKKNLNFFFSSFSLQVSLSLSCSASISPFQVCLSLTFTTPVLCLSGLCRLPADSLWFRPQVFFPSRPLSVASRLSLVSPPCLTTVGCQPTISCFRPFSRAILALPVASRLSLVTPQLLCHPGHSRLPADSAEVGFEPLPLP